jgi:hypothetical protein
VTSDRKSDSEKDTVSIMKGVQDATSTQTNEDTALPVFAKADLLPLSIALKG